MKQFEGKPNPNEGILDPVKELTAEVKTIRQQAFEREAVPTSPVGRALIVAEKAVDKIPDVFTTAVTACPISFLAGVVVTLLWQSRRKQS